MTSPSTSLPPAILVWSGKGGVGKSTVAANLAVALTGQGRRVGFFDADFHGPSAPVVFGVEDRMAVRDGRIVPVEARGVQVVSSGFLAGPRHAHVWHGLLLEGAMRQLLEDTDYTGCDVLVVDLPPGTGEIQTSILGSLRVAGAVLVTTPHELAYADVLRSVDLLATAEVDVIAVVENMAYATCTHCAHDFVPFPGEAGRRLAEAFPAARLVRLPLDDAMTSVSGKGLDDVTAAIEAALTGP